MPFGAQIRNCNLQLRGHIFGSVGSIVEDIERHIILPGNSSQTRPVDGKFETTKLRTQMMYADPLIKRNAWTETLSMKMVATIRTIKRHHTSHPSGLPRYHQFKCNNRRQKKQRNHQLLSALHNNSILTRIFPLFWINHYHRQVPHVRM